MRKLILLFLLIAAVVRAQVSNITPFNSSLTGSTTTITYAPVSTVPAGSAVAFVVMSNTAGIALTSVTDTNSDTFTIDLSAPAPGYGRDLNVNWRMYRAYACNLTTIIGTPPGPGVGFNFNFSGSTSGYVTGILVSGADTRSTTACVPSTSIDTSAVPACGGSPCTITLTSVTPTASSAAVLSFSAGSSSYNVPGAGWTGIPTAGSCISPNICSEYKLFAAVGTYSATYSMNAGGITWGGASIVLQVSPGGSRPHVQVIEFHREHAPYHDFSPADRWKGVIKT